LLDNDRRKIELLNALLMSLPGTPIVYYGDEIGMGDNIYLGDRNGVRTPMQWTGGWTGGFSLADPERLYSPVVSNEVYFPQAVNVKSEQRSPHSMLSWMKHLIKIRKSTRTFSQGSIEFLHPANHRVLAYVRRLGNETLLIVNNLSSSAQAVELDLKQFKGTIPMEMSGGSILPRIGDVPYLMTLGAYQFFWFKLRRL
jgi:maltose alpha-D-glucosyltransferase/alpha-amylase